MTAARDGGRPLEAADRAAEEGGFERRAVEVGQSSSHS